MTTSNFFEAGHRIRIEVPSRNFPRFDRNMNMGGKNYDETTDVTAHNAVHHSRQYPSEIKLTVMKKAASGHGQPVIGFAPRRIVALEFKQVILWPASMMNHDVSFCDVSKEKH